MPTKPQKTEEVYQFVVKYFDERRFSPSLREIGEACGISIPTVMMYLAWLEGQGRIRRKIGIARSIVVLDTDKRTD